MKKIFVTSILLLLSACSSSQIDRLEWLGKEPPFQPVQPKFEENLVWPAKNVSEAEQKELTNRSANSLWNKSSKTFFKDQRATRVGDILRVKIVVADKAQLDNKTERKRNESTSAGVPNFFGLEKRLTGVLPGKADPASLLSTTGTSNATGDGKIEREEKVTSSIAAVVTNILPNGNFVIYGSQEMRVNFEVRQVTVQGVVRPEDIDPNNEIESSQIAEARINYGGKGVITDIQQPRIGSQVADILSPW